MKTRGLFKFYLVGACTLQCLTALAQNVGISTNTPSSSGYGHSGTNRLLEIYNSNSSADAQSHIVLSTGATTPGSMGTITWASPALSGTDKRMALVGASYESGSTAGNAGSALLFSTRQLGTAGIKEAMRITGAGKVGIGTANPSASLEVLGQLAIDQRTTGGIGGLLIKGLSPVLNYPNIGFSTRNAASQDVVAALISGEIVSNATNAEAIDMAFYTANNGSASLSEKLRIKGNGAIAIGGNTGIVGQVLSSNGSGAGAQWKSMSELLANYSSRDSLNLFDYKIGGAGSTGWVTFNNATINFSCVQGCKALLWLNMDVYPNSCPNFNDCSTVFQTKFLIDNIGSQLWISSIQALALNFTGTSISNGPFILDLAPGSHTIQFQAQDINGSRYPKVVLKPLLMLY